MNKPVPPSLVPTLDLTACQTPRPVAPVYGPTNPTPTQVAQAPVKTYASMVELNPDMEEQYRQLHANVWPEVRAAIRKANIRDYNIYVVELNGKKYLFSQFEYVGDNPAADFAGIAEDATTRDKWWPLTDACQVRLPGTPVGQQWKPLEQVMHID